MRLPYNKIFARTGRHASLGRAPAPRRFAQGMAASFLIETALAMGSTMPSVALAIQVLLVFAMTGLMLWRFCVGSFVFMRFIGAGSSK